MLTDSVFMIRPAAFGFDEQTAATNSFQRKDTGLDPSQVSQKGIEEFDEMVRRLRAAGISVFIGQDEAPPARPNAVFPNNWVSFHRTGTVITYPMATPSRRIERRESYLEELGAQFQIRQHIRLDAYEREGKFLEGTGSLVLDRDHRKAYACQSLRTYPELVAAFCERFDFQSIFFHAADASGVPVYHTNVLMALGNDFAILCEESIPDAAEKNLVVKHLESSGKEVIPISFAQMEAFAGNMMALKNKRGEKVLVMSQQALHSLRRDQIQRLEKYTRLLDVPLYTIEKVSGGSARCMMAEIFLPGKEETPG